MENNQNNFETLDPLSETLQDPSEDKVNQPPIFPRTSIVLSSETLEPVYDGGNNVETPANYFPSLEDIIRQGPRQSDDVAKYFTARPYESSLEDIIRQGPRQSDDVAKYFTARPYESSLEDIIRQGPRQSDDVAKYFTARPYESTAALQSFSQPWQSDLNSFLAAMDSQQTSSRDSSSDTQTNTGFAPQQPTRQEWNPESDNTQQPMYFNGTSHQTQGSVLRRPMATLVDTVLEPTTSAAVLPQWPLVDNQTLNPSTFGLQVTSGHQQTQLPNLGPAQLYYSGSTQSQATGSLYALPNQHQVQGGPSSRPYNLQPYPAVQATAAGYPTQAPTASRSQQKPAKDPSKERRYQCPYCGHRAKRPSALKIHICIHTGEKPFPCTWPNCKRGGANGFGVKSNLTRHLKTHQD